MNNNRIFLFLAAVLSGFALLRAPFADSFLEVITPVTDIIGLLAILVFALFLIYKGIMNLFGK